MPPGGSDEFFIADRELLPGLAHFFRGEREEKMRACFLGQNVCALGFGVATLQTPKFEALPSAPQAGDSGEPAGHQDSRNKSFLPLPAQPSFPAGALLR